MIALGIDGVVVAPVGDGRHCNAGAETIGVRHCVEREGAAPAPSPPAQTPRIELRNLIERGIHHGQLILKLHGTEVAVGRLGEGAAAEAHAAIIGAEHGKSVLREHIVEEQAVAATGSGLPERAGPP